MLRWTQVAAMNPLFENGGNGEHRPWIFDDETLEVYRFFLWLHEELRPFYYSRGNDAFDQGTAAGPEEGLRPEEGGGAGRRRRMKAGRKELGGRTKASGRVGIYAARNMWRGRQGSGMGWGARVLPGSELVACAYSCPAPRLSSPSPPPELIPDLTIAIVLPFPPCHSSIPAPIHRYTCCTRFPAFLQASR